MVCRSREHGERAGNLDLIAWDIAAWRHIGGIHDVDKNELYLPLGFMTEVPDPNTGELAVIDKARIVFKRPEPTHIEFDMPLVAINRDDVTVAPNRLFAPSEQYRVPAEGATRVSACGVLGWSHYEIKEQDEPYDLIYTYEAWARHKVVAQQIFQMLMARVPANRGRIVVTDDLGCERAYAIQLQGTSDLTEVLSLVDRVPGFSVTMQVEGELTLRDRTSVGVAVTGETGDEAFDEDDPDPGPGGIFAQGAVNVSIIPDEPEDRLVDPVEGISPGVYGFETEPGS